MRHFLGVYAAIWLHEILHGLPAYFLIGPWGFGQAQSGVTIAIPIGGIYIPNYPEWLNYSNKTSVTALLALIVMIFFAPYVVHGLAYLINRSLEEPVDILSEDVKYHGFFGGLWSALAMPHKSMLIDIMQGIFWLCVFVGAIFVSIVK